MKVLLECEDFAKKKVFHLGALTLFRYRQRRRQQWQELQRGSVEVAVVVLVSWHMLSFLLSKVSA